MNKWLLLGLSSTLLLVGVGAFLFFFKNPAPTQPVVFTEPPTPSTDDFPKMKVKAYLVALDDNGKMGKQIGCGDSVVPVIVEVEPTKDLIRGALDGLFSIKGQTEPNSGLYNALYQSSLSVDKVIQKEKHGDVYLTGTVQLGGVCDEPRFKEQLMETSLQFGAMNDVTIYINGKTLDQTISQKGE